MVEITVLEVTLPDAQFVAPFARTGGEADREPGNADRATDAADGSGDARGGALAALLVLVGLAALAWYLGRGR